MLNNRTNYPVLIITGMHRSGTSLTAAFLQAIGINLGDNLLRGNYWNPKGYFEDTDFVEFQRKILQTCSPCNETGFPDWGWTESEQLDKQKLNTNKEPAQQLVKSRSHQSGLWGWKDPRTSLMLDFWNQIIPNACYLFVYRYPWDVADSILRLNIPFFAERPESCLKIWKFYNRHILEFYKKHSHQCLLVSLNALLASPDQVLELLTTKLNLRLKYPDKQAQDIKNILMSVYDPQLLSSLHLNHPLINILNLTSGGCFELLNQLDLAADLASPFSRLSLQQNSGTLERLSLRLHQESIKVKLNVDSPQFLSWLSGCIDRYHHSTSHQSALTELRQARDRIAEFWKSATAEKLKNSYFGGAGKAHKMLLASGMRDEPLTDAEQRAAEELSQYVATGFDAAEAIQYLLAVMLYRRADQLPLQYGRTAVPQWFLNDLLEFMLYFPSYFQEIGEVENYADYMQQLVDLVHSRVFSNPNSEIWQNVALIFADTVNFVPLYFSTKNLKNIYTKRSDILEFILKSRGHQIDVSFSKRPANRTQIRLGILKVNFAPISETFTTIPAFEHLDRDRFEIILYVLGAIDRPLDVYCQSRADKLVKLPNELHSQVEIIRADDLDILFVGSIVTNATQNIILLALHRLARLQTTYFASPVTTGIRNIDYYISGNLTEPLQAQTQYSEQLVMMDGTGFCFNYNIQKEEARINPDRKNLGISETSVIFISGANTFKIIPEIRETWAKIIAAVPDSVLVLYPFGNTWSGSYIRQPFVNKMYAIFDKYGIDRNRLILLTTLPNREDVKAVLKLADVYLDSYPYAGANSTVDPLEVGLPTVVRDGNSLRSRQGAAMLRDIQLFDLIADSEESYIKLSIELGTNAELRKQKREQIEQKMQQKPRFMDSRAYSATLGEVFQKLLKLDRL
ncbi:MULTISPECIES: sulfotransferase [unclassified Microcoleus]|uniref:O-linked N-acetylglucosamine transferase family protein n=1 Tax=unclassified Microcoleus TaxID=2642155 RepID=UPI002FD474AF